MTPDNEAARVAAIAEGLERATTGGKLRFSLFSGEGWVTAAREDTIRLLCDLWNNRKLIAGILRAHLQREQTP